MAGEVRGDVERLEEYTETTLGMLPDAEAAVESYQDAVGAYLDAQPNDLGTGGIHDRSPQIAADVLELQALDVQPRAFATALRILDAGGGDVRTATAGADFQRLVAAQLAPADVDMDGEVAGTDLSGLLGDAWRGTNPLFVADGTSVDGALWWSGHVAGLPTTTIAELNKHLIVHVDEHVRAGSVVAAHSRWWPRTAGVMNRAASANTVTRLASSRWLRWGGPATGFVTGGIGEANEVLGNSNLTDTEKGVRITTAAGAQGLGAWAGGAAGAKAGALGGAAIGTLICPGVGTAIGAAVGGIAGAVGGGWLGGEAAGWAHDQLDWAWDGIADGIDAGVDMVSDVGGDIIDGAGDLIDGAGDLLGSIF